MGEITPEQSVTYVRAIAAFLVRSVHPSASEELISAFIAMVIFVVGVVGFIIYKKNAYVTEQINIRNQALGLDLINNVSEKSKELYTENSMLRDANRVLNDSLNDVTRKNIQYEAQIESLKKQLELQDTIRRNLSKMITNEKTANVIKEQINDPDTKI